MMRQQALVILSLLAAASALAEERSPEAAPDARDRPHGILSHGDSASFMEDFFGPQVQREPRETQDAARDKRDPGVRWNVPGSAR